MTHDPLKPIECPTCGKIHTRCKGHKPGGTACNRWPHKGSAVCDSHGGKAPKVRARAVVRAEVMSWGLTDEHVDPGELMLRLVSQSAARVTFYAGLLQQAYEAAERLRAAQEVAGPDDEATQTARLDFERVMNTGGVAVLIGHTYAGTQTSGVIATGEAIRGLAKLEEGERDRAMNFASKAKAAGIAAEQLAFAKRMGDQLMTALIGVVAALGHSPDDPLVRSAIHAQVAALLGGAQVIDGSVMS